MARSFGHIIDGGIVMRNTLAMASILVASCAVGCGKTSSEPAVADAATAAQPQTASDGYMAQFATEEPSAAKNANSQAEPAAANVQTEPAADDASTGTSVGLAKQAFLAANDRVMALICDLIKALDGVTDEASAQAAAPRIAELTPQWQSAAKIGTAAYLALDDDEEVAIYKEAMQASYAKQGELELTHRGNLLDQMRRIAKSPGGPAIERELVALRDAILETKGIYSPKLMRERMAEKLGGAGSPLTTD
jgi:hypothetical protein